MCFFLPLFPFSSSPPSLSPSLGIYIMNSVVRGDVRCWYYKKLWISYDSYINLDIRIIARCRKRNTSYEFVPIFHYFKSNILKLTIQYPWRPHLLHHRRVRLPVRNTMSMLQSAEIEATLTTLRSWGKLPKVTQDYFLISISLMCLVLQARAGCFTYWSERSTFHSCMAHLSRYDRMYIFQIVELVE